MTDHDAERQYHDEMQAEHHAEIEREREDERLALMGDGPEPPPCQAELDAWAMSDIEEDLLARGAYEDIAPVTGPPCDECEWPLAAWANGRRWYHQERRDLDADHDARPCVCVTQNGIVQEADPWCPLHGCEDALSGALWTNPQAARDLSRSLVR